MDVWSDGKDHLYKTSNILLIYDSWKVTPVLSTI